jgi:hypothetical protein
MPVNQSARNVRITIGGKDFTPCLMSFQGSDSHLDQSGLITFTGTILLGNALGFDESLDDRKNPTRFCRGVPVILEVANLSGALVRHPRGALRILTPKYDIEKQQMTLEVGDLISVLNFKEPTDPDKADNKSCDGKPAGDIIITLLQQSGINSIGGALPSTIYNYPLNLSGSYLASVGKLLYANNMFAWIDKNEIFQVQTANIVAGAGITMAIGQDEIWYRRLNGAESPVEIVKATGTEMIVRPPLNPMEDTTEQYSAASTVDKDYGNFSIILELIERIQDWDKDTHKLRITTNTYKPYGLVIPEVFWGENPPKITLVQSEINIEDSYFETKTECKLKLKRTKTYHPRLSYLAEYKEANPSLVADNVMQLVKSSEDNYEYDIKDRLKKITTSTSEIAITILNNTDENWSEWEFPPEDLVLSEYKIQEWKEFNKDTWEYHASSLQCLVRVNPSAVKYLTGSEVISNKTNLIPALNSERRLSNSGQELPPAPERCPTECNYEEKNIEEKVIFGDICASDLNPRERTFTVEFLAGRMESALKPGEVVLQSTTGGRSAASQQLQAIAQREGRLLQGRYKGQELATYMQDEIFSYYPLYPVTATEPDGTVQNYLADGCNWVVSQTKALWSCDGIWVGTSVGGSVVLPYFEVNFIYLGGGSGVEFTSYAYSLETTTVDVYLGGGSGVDFTQGLAWDNITEVYWDMSESDWNNLT